MADSTLNIPDDVLRVWQRAMNTLADLVGVPSALIMRAEPPYIEVFVANDSDANPYRRGQRERMAGLYCEKVIRTRERLIIRNALLDAEWKDNQDAAQGMISYVGMPLEWPDGTAFGTICMLDRQEKDYSGRHAELLEQFADVIQTYLALLKQNEELESRLAGIAALRGLVPVCSSCGKPHGDPEYLRAVVDRVMANVSRESTGYVCPSCVASARRREATR